MVTWYSSVWFKDHIPKHAFTYWLAVQNRLTTRDRIRSWGVSVPEECLLCSSSAESRGHLFFSCAYSQAVWNSFFLHPSLSPPSSLEDMLSWVNGSFRTNKLKIICKLILQAVVYHLWMERNARLHSPSSKASHSLVKDIQLTLRAKLSGLDRAELLARMTSPSSTIRQESYIHTWFEFIQF